LGRVWDKILEVRETVPSLRLSPRERGERVKRGQQEYI
jgi:hypothetical protein